MALEEIFGRGSYVSGSKNFAEVPSPGSNCELLLTFENDEIVKIIPGAAFRASRWEKKVRKIRFLLGGSKIVGRDYSFSSFRVDGYWIGLRSGVRILPPHETAPDTSLDMGEHPFILEFPLIGYLNNSRFTNSRRLLEHRSLTLLLNLLLVGRTNTLNRTRGYFWAATNSKSTPSTEYVQSLYSADLGRPVVSRNFSRRRGRHIAEVAPEDYYWLVGHDGKSLRVPTDLDDQICNYQALLPSDRGKFDRALFWLDQANYQWNDSKSASFVSLVSALESLTQRGTKHQAFCEACNRHVSHDEPGATRRFKTLLEDFGSGIPNKMKEKVYDMRSRISHGSSLLSLDTNYYSSLFTSWLDEHNLQDALWCSTQNVLREWLRKC